jgi:Icc-related predicted phosphoesterase
VRILAISDVPEHNLYDALVRDQSHSGIDLVVSCGDLDRDILEFLVTCLSVPLFYVPGNHDASFRTKPPAGCDSLDGTIREVNGLRFGGIGGSIRYNADHDAYQYSGREMGTRAWLLGLKARLKGRVDVMVSHSAPLSQAPFGPAPDRAHQGIAAFRSFIQRHQPKFWLHGHNHLLPGLTPRISRIDSTIVINAYGHYLFDTDWPFPVDESLRGEVALRT